MQQQTNSLFFSSSRDMDAEGSNLLEGTNMNEHTYTSFFLIPIDRNCIIKRSWLCKVEAVSKRMILVSSLFRFINSFLQFSFETHLKCDTKHVNEELGDTERRSSGAKIDIITIHKLYRLEVAIYKVSGENNKVDLIHFIGDRIKLCKNQRTMFKVIEESVSTTDISKIEEINSMCNPHLLQVAL